MPEFRELYMQFRGDGTIAFSRARGKWDYEWMSLDYTFDGTRLSITETAFAGGERDKLPDYSCAAAEGAPSGVYEMQLLANGNLKFVNAQDKCQWRREILTLAEWTPVQ
jgi:hypothetical protein